ncbi:hypothetical protein HJD18_11890 [Thermoleophilia bacterium SCSIO 60948]|nr:hypothetical protein HJD18_11890 [Thermoleophilia bacterium SCSIO 60948]
MAAARRTARQMKDERDARLLDEMHTTIAEGRMTVRQMTPSEREASDAQFAAGADARERRARKTRARGL